MDEGGQVGPGHVWPQPPHQIQLNLNEYVAALIALKQKIIDTDHLLTEYQQKCGDILGVSLYL
uniref:Uncharacterized protein n=1 Tax=Sphenodon punctatus TaxID=8508 RepID=A0A8D0HBJ1_SPHPU